MAVTIATTNNETAVVVKSVIIFLYNKLAYMNLECCFQRKPEWVLKDVFHETILQDKNKFQY